LFSFGERRGLKKNKVCGKPPKMELGSQPFYSNMKSSQIQDFAQLSLSPPEFFIPEDIILEIVEHLPLLSDVLNFSLTVRANVSNLYK